MVKIKFRLLFKDNKKKILDPPTIESVAQLIKTGKGILLISFFFFFFFSFL
jgi:hypothetical protein